MRCLLCASEAGFIDGVNAGGRGVLRCGHCRLVFVDPAERLTPEKEKARYDLHDNRPDDPRYIGFLRQLLDPLTGRIAPPADGLDFGCGSGPAVAPYLARLGYAVANYDPFYAPDAGVLIRTYDFITATEVLEHVYDPADVFSRLDRMLRPGGVLAVMTRLMTRTTDLTAWWYLRDPTHVCFYERRTLEWVARRHQWSMEVMDDNVVFFQKPA